MSSDTILQPDILIDSSITYTLRVTDNAGHVDSAFIRFETVFNPTIIVDSVYCNGNVAMHIPQGISAISWFADSAQISGANSRYNTAFSPGKYYVSGTVQTGYNSSHIFTCPVQSDTVIVQPIITPTLTFSNDTVFSSHTGIQYEWYLNNVLIYTGTDSFLVVNQTGTYHVAVIMANLCTYTSAPISVIYTGISNLTNRDLIFPNPFSDKITVSASGEQRVIITDPGGKKIIDAKIYSDYTFDLGFLAKGCYFVTIINGTQTRRAVIGKI